MAVVKRQKKSKYVYRPENKTIVMGEPTDKITSVNGVYYLALDRNELINVVNALYNIQKNRIKNRSSLSGKCKLEEIEEFNDELIEAVSFDYVVPYTDLDTDEYEIREDSLSKILGEKPVRPAKPPKKDTKIQKLEEKYGDKIKLTDSKAKKLAERRSVSSERTVSSGDSAEGTDTDDSMDESDDDVPMKSRKVSRVSCSADRVRVSRDAADRVRVSRKDSRSPERDRKRSSGSRRTGVKVRATE